MEPVTGVFLQYSALGAIALLALWAVKVLYGRADEDRAYHRTRADRLETNCAPSTPPCASSTSR
jgi:hypothetical protein